MIAEPPGQHSIRLVIIKMLLETHSIIEAEGIFGCLGDTRSFPGSTVGRTRCVHGSLRRRQQLRLRHTTYPKGRWGIAATLLKIALWETVILFAVDKKDVSVHETDSRVTKSMVSLFACSRVIQWDRPLSASAPPSGCFPEQQRKAPRLSCGAYSTDW